MNYCRNIVHNGTKTETLASSRNRRFRQIRRANLGQNDEATSSQSARADRFRDSLTCPRSRLLVFLLAVAGVQQLEVHALGAGDSAQRAFVRVADVVGAADGLVDVRTLVLAHALSKLALGAVRALDAVAQICGRDAGHRVGFRE